MKKLLLLSLLFSSQISVAQNLEIGETEIVTNDLKIKRIAENTYLHLSYMETEQYGRIESNGGIIVLQNEAMIYDTPHNVEITFDLVDWMFNQGWTISGVVGSHFHYDGIGGIQVFEDFEIPTYGHLLSPELINSSDYEVVPPENLLNGKLQLKLANQHVNIEYFGPGHSNDNIILWFPEDKVLFGGCLIKSLRAGKGNLDDANLDEWSNTVRKIIQSYGDSLEIVVPGHGLHGGAELLNKTVEMFAQQ